ncbi:MAG: glycerophosphodiester phosphodiesterase family protein [Acidimicrobiales bacterium]
MKRLVVAAMVVAAMLGLAPVSAQPDDSWIQRRVLNVAHAGGDLEAPHSTLYAMKTAVAAGTDVLEMDLRLSADGVLMVHHDTTVNRTTEATGVMSDFTAAELGALDNAYWFVPNCWSCPNEPVEAYHLRGIRTGAQPAPAGFEPADFAIPTLARVAEAFPDRILDVEIKDGPTGMAAAEALADFIDDNGPADRYLVASFDDAIMAHFKSLAPHVATSPGLGEMTTWFGSRGPLPHHQVLQVPPSFSGIDVVTQQFVDDAHANDLAVWVWFNGTNDDAEATWRHLIDLGVDALLTGKPDAAQAVIDDEGVGFTAPAEIDPSSTRRGRTIEVSVTCPAAQVDTCTGPLIVIAPHRRGHIALVALQSIDIARGQTEAITLRIRRGAGGALRDRPTTATAIVWPSDTDTAPTVTPITISRKLRS